MAAVGPQVQLLVLQMYFGVVHGLDWSLLKSELYTFALTDGSTHMTGVSLG